MVAANTSNTGQSVLEQDGPNIIHHVSNSSKEHPIIKLPELFGIDFSVTKHVLMLWVVVFIVSFVIFSIAVSMIISITAAIVNARLYVPGAKMTPYEVSDFILHLKSLVNPLKV